MGYLLLNSVCEMIIIKLSEFYFFILSFSRISIFYKLFGIHKEYVHSLYQEDVENKYNKEIEVLSNENGVLKKEIENLNKNKINSELAYDALVEENTNLKQQIKQLSLQIEKIRINTMLQPLASATAPSP